MRVEGERLTIPQKEEAYQEGIEKGI